MPFFFLRLIERGLQKHAFDFILRSRWWVRKCNDVVNNYYLVGRPSEQWGNPWLDALLPRFHISFHSSFHVTFMFTFSNYDLCTPTMIYKTIVIYYLYAANSLSTILFTKYIKVYFCAFDLIIFY